MNKETEGERRILQREVTMEMTTGAMLKKSG
jgi:hypothetical protein